VSDERIRASRKRFEKSLNELSEAVDSELGWAPRLSRWVVPLAACAVGLVLGAAFRRALPRLRERN
jgi:hypothetical protein